MYTDKGFSHAIAKAVLEDLPNNSEAKRILAQPENKFVDHSGSVIDLDEVNIVNAKREALEYKLKRMAL